jgi:hypothetical protein
MLISERDTVPLGLGTTEAFQLNTPNGDLADLTQTGRLVVLGCFELLPPKACVGDPLKIAAPQIPS